METIQGYDGLNGAQALTGSEIDALLDGVSFSPQGRHDRAMIGVMLYCLVRPGVLPGLRVSNYRREDRRRTLAVPVSGTGTRELAMDARAAEALDVYLDAADIGDDTSAPLFRLANGKEALRAARAYARRAGIVRPFTWHTLRDTGIALFLSEGRGIREIADLAGFYDASHLMPHRRPGDANSGIWRKESADRHP